jgi:protocatechuate 4,5-dioxygenase, beta chain
MARIVGGFLMPHNPIITSAPPELGEASQRATVFSSFAEIARRVRELSADTAIVIGDDHYTIFGPHCIPQCLIGIGDVDGPVEPWLNIERGPIANNELLARHILEQGWGDRIDWSFAKALTVDHAIAVPYHLAIRENPGLKTIPVYLNAGVEPYISSRRAAQIGASIGRAVQSWDRDERVVIYGTGGLSHWVGCKGAGQVNEGFDRRILDICERGDVEALIALPDDVVDREGGNGCLEIKNWICAMAAMGDVKAETLAYEPMPEWITGLAFAQLNPVAAGCQR